MPFWMQTEDPEYYPDGPFEDDGDQEWEQGDYSEDAAIDNNVYYGA